MKKTLIGIGAIAALIGAPALAADMPVKAPPPAPAPASSWTGFYLGGQIGWDYQNAPTMYAADPGGPFLVGVSDALANGALASSTSQSGSGFLGGITAGYNVQSGFVVWGVEADLDGVHNQHTSNITPPGVFPFPLLTTDTATQTNWLATVRGRLGVTVLPDTLVFGTGGLAVGGVGASTSIIPSTGPAPELPSSCANNAYCSAGSTTTTRSGWTIGGGTEHMFTPHLTVKIEYLYYNLGTMNYIAAEQASFTGVVGAPVVDVHTSLTGQMVRAGLNYKFN